MFTSQNKNSRTNLPFSSLLIPDIFAKQSLRVEERRCYSKPTFQLIDHCWMKQRIMADSKLHVCFYRSVTYPQTVHYVLEVTFNFCMLLYMIFLFFPPALCCVVSSAEFQTMGVVKRCLIQTTSTLSRMNLKTEVFTPKTDKVSSVHTIPRFQIVFHATWARANSTVLTSAFSKTSILAVYLTQLAGVFKFIHARERFQKVPFLVTENGTLERTKGQSGETKLRFKFIRLSVECQIVLSYVLTSTFFMLGRTQKIFLPSMSISTPPTCYAWWWPLSDHTFCI